MTVNTVSLSEFSGFSEHYCSDTDTAKALEAEMLASPDQQLSQTDPDARSVMTSVHGSGMVGYNVQSAVETGHHLIVEHEVTNAGSDREQLSKMAIKAKWTMDTERLSVVADRGYFKGEQLLACHDANIETYVPRTETSNAAAEGRFGKQDFIYDANQDEYRCPAGDRLVWRMTTTEHGMTLHRYWSSNCQNCSLKSRCTPSKERRVTRWEHESILEANHERLDKNPGIMYFG